MALDPYSTEIRILDRLCAMPRPVRGISAVMLDQAFGQPEAIARMAEAGLIRLRNWHDGPPGGIWMPTDAGERLHETLASRAGHNRGEA